LGSLQLAAVLGAVAAEGAHGDEQRAVGCAMIG